MIPRYEVGEVVWHVVEEDSVTIEEVHPRPHGNDDYWVRNASYYRYWAETSDLEPLELPNA